MGYNWYMGRGAMLRWWDGWVAEHADGCRELPLVLLSCLQKMAIRRVGRGCEGKSSQSGRRGVTSHKHARVHNYFKSEDLILKRKVCILYAKSLSVSDVKVFNYHASIPYDSSKTTEEKLER